MGSKTANLWNRKLWWRESNHIPEGFGADIIAIDVTKFSSLSLEEREELPGATNFTGEELEQMTVLYERNDHKLLHSLDAVVLWDELCGRGTEIISLTELGYDESKGDRIEVGPGGNLLHVTVGAETQYFQVIY